MVIAASYKGYRYPIEVIGHAVWLYHRFTLSLRDVEEPRPRWWSPTTIRSWCASSGRTTPPSYVGGDRPGDKWHFDEVGVKINGTTHYLWRGRPARNVLDICSRAATRWRPSGFSVSCPGLRYVPRVIVTDKLASYQVVTASFCRW